MPIVSVIIPTRNRQLYAVKTVRQIHELNEDIEIIVQDNSDTDELYKELEDLIRAGAVIYDYVKDPLPFSENYNLAAEKASGDFFCAIGDDDGILPNIISCAEWMDKNGIDIIKPAKDQKYHYPGNKNRRYSACLGFNKYSGSFHYANLEAGMISLLSDGGCEYLKKDLAGSYHGLVRMSAMQRVKELTGKYYSGLTPDMYSVTCLSLLPDIRFAVLDYPISLPGICPVSGSAASSTGKHAGKLEDAPHLKYLPDYQWDDRIPRYYSVETIWAETMLFAADKMGRNDLVEKYFDRDRLLYHLYMNNADKRKVIMECLNGQDRMTIADSCGNLADADVAEKLRRLCVKASGKLFGGRKMIHGIREIGHATEVMDRELKKQKTAAPWEISGI